MQIETIPDGLRVLAPAKLNLYLEVGEKREDRFHEIDGLFQCVSLFDELEFRLTKDGAIDLAEEGLGQRENNLVYRAADVLQKRFLPGSTTGVRIRLHKRIPVGAGLGGGSSDAAATLIALAKLWKLRVSLDELRSLGAELGSDVPFFFHGGTARCRGRGERLTGYNEVFDAEAPFHYVLVYPGIAVSTKAVYEALDRERGEFTLTAPSPLDSMSPISIHELLVSGKMFFNRLECVAGGLFPELQEVASLLKEESFLKVSMTGSGSAFFGLCRDAEDASRAADAVRTRLRNAIGGQLHLGRLGGSGGFLPPRRELGAGSYGSGGDAGISAVKVYKVRSEPSYEFSWLA